MMNNKNQEKEHRPVSVYLHFPFCVRKCRYCDFLSGPASEEDRERYVNALCREIRGRTAEAGEHAEADTVFLGGGTPSLLTPEQLERIMEAVRSGFDLQPDAEISMEVNPGTAKMEELRACREIGVNRLSVGVQSFDDAELRLLGRIHTAEQAGRTIRDARAAGFDNLNIDMMSALPGQTMEAWKRNLAEAVAAEPEHISAYSLILEEGTPLCLAYADGTIPQVPDEEEDRAMYHFTRDFLSQYGFERYEISNYARPGYECRHNCGYWTGHEYLGFGLGAASLLRGERFHEPRDMGEYLEIVNHAWGVSEAYEGKQHSRGFIKPRPETSGKQTPHASPWERLRQESEKLTLQDRMEEFMFLGLRMTAGVSETEFAARFGTEIEAVYGDILRRHEEQEVICRHAGRIFLTEYGLDVANYVMADYLLGG